MSGRRLGESHSARRNLRDSQSDRLGMRPGSGRHEEDSSMGRAPSARSGLRRKEQEEDVRRQGPRSRPSSGASRRAGHPKVKSEISQLRSIVKELREELTRSKDKVTQLTKQNGALRTALGHARTGNDAPATSSRGSARASRPASGASHRGVQVPSARAHAARQVHHRKLSVNVGFPLSSPPYVKYVTNMLFLQMHFCFAHHYPFSHHHMHPLFTHVT
jgi:hypothetical protein